MTEIQGQPCSRFPSRQTTKCPRSPWALLRALQHHVCSFTRALEGHRAVLATSSDPGQSPLEPVCSKSSHLPHFSSSRELSWASQHLEFLFPPQRLSNYNKIRSHHDNHFCPGTTPSLIPFNFQSVTAVRNGSRAPAPGQSHGTGCRCPSPLSREPLLLTGNPEEPDPRTHSAAETLPSVAPLPLPLATHR